MRRRILIHLALVATLLSTSMPAHAVDTSLPRDQQVAYITNTYVSRLDAEMVRLNAIKAKMASQPSLLAQYKAFLSDYTGSYNTIKDALASQSADLNTTDDFAAEEVGEFDNTVYQLEQMAAKVKSISCVKGKVSKIVLGLKPVCPKGYIKKK